MACATLGILRIVYRFPTQPFDEQTSSTTIQYLPGRRIRHGLVRRISSVLGGGCTRGYDSDPQAWRFTFLSSWLVARVPERGCELFGFHVVVMFRNIARAVDRCHPWRFSRRPSSRSVLYSSCLLVYPRSV